MWWEEEFWNIRIVEIIEPVLQEKHWAMEFIYLGWIFDCYKKKSSWPFNLIICNWLFVFVCVNWKNKVRVIVKKNQTNRLYVLFYLCGGFLPLRCVADLWFRSDPFIQALTGFVSRTKRWSEKRANWAGAPWNQTGSEESLSDSTWFAQH